MKCEYQGCENEAEFWDDSDNKVCSDCMERGLSEGVDPEDFERLPERARRQA